MKARIPITTAAAVLAVCLLFTVCQAAPPQSAGKVLTGKWKVDWEESAERTKDRRASAQLEFLVGAGAHLEMHFKNDGTMLTYLSGGTGGKKTRTSGAGKCSRATARKSCSKRSTKTAASRPGCRSRWSTKT